MPFARDRFTWLAYLMLACYAYFQAASGPLMPFLSDELNLSYTVRGLHFSGFAFGMMLAGATGGWLAERFSRTAIFWSGGVGMVLAVLFFMVAHRPELTILALFLVGYMGTTVLVTIQAALADYHGANRAIALTEANIAASVSAVCVPLLIGGFQGAGIGWRGALVTGIVFWLLLALVYRQVSLPESSRNKNATQANNPLPPIFWIFVGVIVITVSIEWCIVYWAADFLDKHAGLSKVNASTAMSLYFVAMVISRAAGSWMTRRARLRHLLLAAAIVSTVGFVPFWVLTVPVPALIGMFALGLGIANLFPFVLSIGTSVVAHDQTDAASSRLVLFAGLAMLVTPQILGTVADQTNIATAYGIVMGLLVVLVMLIAWANGKIPHGLPV